MNMKKEKSQTEKVSKGISEEGRILGVIKMPHSTEKAAALAEKNNAYVFLVAPGANKIMIRHAVERNYGVSVESVRTATSPAKARVRGRIIGWKPGFKKAMVSLKKGEKIELQ